MSTLQHTLQPAFRNRLALLVVVAGAMAALTVALIMSVSNSSSPAPHAQPSKAAIERQLEAVSGPRYGIQRPGAVVRHMSPQQQLQAVAGARYGIHAPR